MFLGSYQSCCEYIHNSYFAENLVSSLLLELNQQILPLLFLNIIYFLSHNFPSMFRLSFCRHIIQFSVWTLFHISSQLTHTETVYFQMLPLCCAYSFIPRDKTPERAQKPATSSDFPRCCRGIVNDVQMFIPLKKENIDWCGNHLPYIWAATEEAFFCALYPCWVNNQMRW